MRVDNQANQAQIQQQRLQQPQIQNQPPTPDATEVAKPQAPQARDGQLIQGGGEELALAATIEQPRQELITTSSLNVRPAPTTQGTQPLDTFPAGARLEVTPNAQGQTHNGDWAHVTGQIDGQTVEGWVHTNYTRENTPPQLNDGGQLVFQGERGETVISPNAPGGLAATYESGNNPGAIGYDRTGGWSYGTHQFAANTGSMDGFLGHLQQSHPEISSRLEAAGGAQGARAGTDAFKSAWEGVANDFPEFGSIQHEYHTQQSSNYRTAVAAAEEVGFDTDSVAMKEAIYSTAMQHGGAGASRVFERAADRIADPGNTGEALQAIYDERGKRDASGELAYFSSSTADVQAGVARRFGQEAVDVQTILRAEQAGVFNGGQPQTPTAPEQTAPAQGTAPVEAPRPEPRPAPDFVIESPDGYMNVRNEPAVNGQSKVGEFANGAELRITPDPAGNTTNGNWTHVSGEGRDGGTVSGWVHNSGLQAAPEPQPTVPTPPQRPDAPAQQAPAAEAPAQQTPAEEPGFLDRAGDFFDNVGETFGNLREGIGDRIDSARDRIGGLADRVGDAIGGLFGGDEAPAPAGPNGNNPAQGTNPAQGADPAADPAQGVDGPAQVADPPAPLDEGPLGGVRTGQEVLQRGADGEAVEELQHLLIENGMTLPRYGADGDFGAETQQALRGFQHTRGLNPTGELNQRTLEALESNAPAQPTPGVHVEDLAGMTQAQQYDYLAALTEENGGTFDTNPNRPNLIGLRNETNAFVNDGQGRYDDQLLVAYVDDAGNKRVENFQFNTEPMGRYENRVGVDADGNGTLDQGRLAAGHYEYQLGQSNRLGDVLRPTAPAMAERDTNHDGFFNDDAEASAGYSMLFHSGGNSNVGSAGCQTMPPGDYDRFWNTLQNLDTGGGFGYTLIQTDRAAAVE